MPATGGGGTEPTDGVGIVVGVEVGGGGEGEGGGGGGEGLGGGGVGGEGEVSVGVVGGSEKTRREHRGGGYQAVRKSRPLKTAVMKRFAER